MLQKTFHASLRTADHGGFRLASLCLHSGHLFNFEFNFQIRFVSGLCECLSATDRTTFHRSVYDASDYRSDAPYISEGMLTFDFRMGSS